MSTPKTDPPLDARRIAEEAADFVRTPFGKHYLEQLSLHYNALHHAAESDDLTAEQKGMKVERAAGVKWSIDYLMERVTLLKQEHYGKKT